MIPVSVADIESLLVGDIEKAIKEVFNFATMVAPSIIFIGEADSLFRARQSSDKSWEQSQVNQLLVCKFANAPLRT